MKNTLYFFFIVCFSCCEINTADTILIIDFGSPITHFIATCISHVKVHSHICCYTQAEKIIKQIEPKGIILSGGPESVIDQNSPRVPECIFSSGVPILGICYGQQLMCVQLGGNVIRSNEPERGETTLHITGTCALTENLWPTNSKVSIWMGHEDSIASLPPGFATIAHTLGSPHAIIADDKRKFYGLQFHPEVQHIKEGHLILHIFALDIVKAQQDFSIIPPKFDMTMVIDPLLFRCCNRNYGAKF